MGNPMPLAERFAPGTEWALTVPYGSIPVGQRVRVEGDIQSYAYDDQDLFVPCSMWDEPDVVVDLPVGILG